ncbi:MAG: DUF2892 domain-containing protein [Methylophilus sp.]|nr:DUF2892 domain-containing protein [Methylophilus sp.]
MQKNIGSVERMIRILVGVILLGLTLTHQIGGWGWIGLVPLITGLVSFCPVYMLFKR